MPADAVPTVRAHFNHAGTSITPAPVLDRMKAHLDLEAAIGGYEAAAAVADELDAVPGLVASMLGVQADEIALTENATRAWELALWSITADFTAADRILVDQFAYGTVHSSLVGLQRDRGFEIAVVGSLADGTIDPGSLADLAAHPRTRLLIVTHMPTHLGTVTDVEPVRAIAADRGILFALDVSQTVGQLPLDLKAIGCDVAFAPGRKFLRAPRGTGFLYVDLPLAERLVPLVLPMGSIDLDDGSLTMPPGLRRFDHFEHGVAARLGLGAAVQLATSIGLDRISELVGSRSQDVVSILDAVEGVRRTGTPADRGIISFTHRTLDATTIQAALVAEGVNTWVNPATGAPLDGARRPVLPSVRVSPHHVTTDDEIDRLDRAMHHLPR